MPKISFGLEGIAKLLSNINHTKAAGPNKLPARHLKETAHQIAPMYTHLFSQSYQHGLLPALIHGLAQQYAQSSRREIDRFQTTIAPFP